MTSGEWRPSFSAWELECIAGRAGQNCSWQRPHNRAVLEDADGWAVALDTLVAAMAVMAADGVVAEAAGIAVTTAAAAMAAVASAVVEVVDHRFEERC